MTSFCRAPLSAVHPRHSWRTIACFAVALTATAMTGCGIGPIATTSSAAASTEGSHPITGQVWGGPNPIAGATITIYATGDASGNSTGYGVATQLAQTTTDSYGNFFFSVSYDCPAGQFAYITSTGGNPGGGTTNNNAVLVAALGRCEDLFYLNNGVYTGWKASNIDIDELTTIAAAYALGHFSSVSGSGNSTIIQIGSDATNNAPQISGTSTGCVANVGSCGHSTVTAGLAHAFENALNLVDSFTQTGNNGTGANIIPSSWTSVTGAPIVPRALINSLANTLVACVNSNGGTAGDATACGQLFKYTTLPSSSPSIVPSYTSATPTNTFTAMVNLAYNPTLNGSTANVANLYYLASPLTSVYTPALTAAPLNDWSIAINFTGNGLGTGLGFVGLGQVGLAYPEGLALDINDNAYVGSQLAADTAPVSILSFASNASLISTSPENNNLSSTAALAVDGSSPMNGYFVNAANSSTNTAGHFTASDGTISSAPTALTTSSNSLNVKPYGLAIDRANNVWVAGTTLGLNTKTLMESTNNGSTFTGIASPTVGSPAESNQALAIDPSQNIWGSFGTPNASSNTFILQNTGTAAAPAYGSSTLTGPTTSGNNEGSITFAGTSGSWAAYIGSANTGSQSNEVSGLQSLTPVLSGDKVTSAAGGTLSSGANGKKTSSVIGGAAGMQADGLGNIVAADNIGHQVVYYLPSTSPTGSTTGPGTAMAYKPCTSGYANAAATATISGGTVTSITVTNTGWGYSALPPLITVSGGGALVPLVATANVTQTASGSGVYYVSSFTIVTGGVGYTTPPAISIGASSTTASTCTSVFSNGAPSGVAVDSAGSIWVTNTSGGNVVEIIGSAAPTWPLKSLGYLGQP